MSLIQLVKFEMPYFRCKSFISRTGCLDHFYPETFSKCLKFPTSNRIGYSERDNESFKFKSLLESVHLDNLHDRSLLNSVYA